VEDNISIHICDWVHICDCLHMCYLKKKNLYKVYYTIETHNACKMTTNIGWRQWRKPTRLHFKWFVCMALWCSFRIYMNNHVFQLIEMSEYPLLFQVLFYHAMSFHYHFPNDTLLAFLLLTMKPNLHFIIYHINRCFIYKKNRVFIYFKYRKKGQTGGGE
jgi:hypothetical protein